jgi:hypothetical protein
LWVSKLPPTTGEHELYVADQLVLRTPDLSLLLDVLESELQLYVAEHARERVFVHAGVVGWKGRALLLPGRSFAGKSTLVEALVRAGATYYSDEYAVLDQEGRVYPYARRLGFRWRGGRPPRRCTAEELGGRRGVTCLPVQLVVVTRFQPGASWRPRSLAAGQALLELMSYTIPAQTYPERVVDALRQVTSRARRLKSSRGEADETADALLRELEIGPLHNSHPLERMIPCCPSRAETSSPFASCPMRR